MQHSFAPLPPAAADVYGDSPPFTQHYYMHPSQHQRGGAPPAAVVPVLYSKPEQQKIHTLFVSGLPNDVKPREIHNLFRRRSGFDFSQLEYTGRGNQVVAFATFFNHHSAMAAMTALNGAIFDPETGATLHIELARSNSRKRSRGDGVYMVIDKRVKVTNDDSESSSNDGDGKPDGPSGTYSDDSGNKDAATSDRDTSKLNNPDDRSNESDVPPCSTLFIANLGPDCTEAELKQVLAKYSGFNTLKIRGRGGMPVAFADFTDVESSTAAMNSLQGSLLESSDRGGMIVEYARSKMRKS